MNPATTPARSTALPEEAASTTRTTGSRLNLLRAGVLGANDGIVSIAGVVIGIAATTTSVPVIATAGGAALVAGALSMATGEYVSVSTQRDTEAAILAAELRSLEEDPEGELAELASMYQAKGLSAELAAQVAVQLTAHDPLGAHADVEHRLDPDDLTNPWEAALASLLSFTAGGILPLAAILLVPSAARIWVTFCMVVLALVFTGWGSARLGKAPARRATIRTVMGGSLAMAVTYLIGSLSGISV